MNKIKTVSRTIFIIFKEHTVGKGEGSRRVVNFSKREKCENLFTLDLLQEVEAVVETYVTLVSD